MAVTFNDDGRIATCHWHPECDKAYQKYADENKVWGEPFEPYEFARGSSLCKHDFKIVNQQASSKGRDNEVG